MISINRANGGSRKGVTATRKDKKDFNSVSIEEARTMLTNSFILNGMNRKISAEIADSISWHRNETGEDGTSISEKLTASEKTRVINSYVNTLQDYGYKGEINIQRKKEVEAKSKYGGSKPVYYTVITF